MVKRFTPRRRGAPFPQSGTTLERRTRRLQLTDQARLALVLSRKEAQLLDCGFVGTEHLLLGLVRESKGKAGVALAALGVTLDGVRSRAKELVGPAGSSSAQPPLTPRSRAVLRLAQREARQLGHESVGTEHLLLALVREGEGVGVEILTSLGVSAAEVRRQIVPLLPDGDRHGHADPRAHRGPGRAGAEDAGAEDAGAEDAGSGTVEPGTVEPGTVEPGTVEPQCGWCRQPLVLRVRLLDAEPGSVPVTVAYCERCGSVVGTVTQTDQG